MDGAFKVGDLGLKVVFLGTKIQNLNLKTLLVSSHGFEVGVHVLVVCTEVFQLLLS